MNLLEKTIEGIKSEKNLEIAVIRAAAADIAKLEQIINSIAAHGFPVTPSVYATITCCGNFCEMNMHVTASHGRAADLIQLLVAKGIKAERAEDVPNTSAQCWHLTAFGTLPITLYIRYPIYPKQAAQAQEVAA